jgi:putative membrane protein insertion efficiency factor
MRPATAALKTAVLAYQWTLRPILGCNCRFHPSCSDYALGALSEHGAVRGTGLAAWRVLRCNPWNAGGYDPVPPGLNRLRSAGTES